jgi:hypothetical protein
VRAAISRVFWVCFDFNWLDVIILVPRLPVFLDVFVDLLHVYLVGAPARVVPVLKKCGQGQLGGLIRDAKHVWCRGFDGIER